LAGTGNGGVTLASFLGSLPAHYVGLGLGYAYTATFTDHRRGVLVFNVPSLLADTTALYLESSNSAVDRGRLILYQNNNSTTPAYCVATVSGGAESVSQGVTGSWTNVTGITVVGGIVTAVVGTPS